MKLLFIHPIFSIYGGGEKVILDLYRKSKQDFDSEIYTIYKTKNLKDIEAYGNFIEKPEFVSLFGYKINPFINVYIKELGILLAMNYEKEDKIILSNFPSSLVYYHAKKYNPEIQDKNTYWVCFEPDRILYYNKYVKLKQMPPDLINKKYEMASKTLFDWREKDTEIIKNVNVITLSNYVTELANQIYNISTTKTSLCMYINPKQIYQIKKRQAINNLNKHYNLNLKEKDFIITALSRLEPGKGFLELMEVLKKLNVPYKCLIGGEGSLSKKLTRRKNGKIKMLGFIPNKLLNSFYSAGNIYVFLGKHETGGPLTVLEAMGCGCVPIATNEAGPLELIEDKKTGFLVNPNNTDEIAELINNLPDLGKIGLDAKETIHKNNTLDIFYNKFKKVIG